MAGWDCRHTLCAPFNIWNEVFLPLREGMLSRRCSSSEEHVSGVIGQLRGTRRKSQTQGRQNQGRKTSWRQCCFAVMFTWSGCTGDRGTAKPLSVEWRQQESQGSLCKPSRDPSLVQSREPREDWAVRTSLLHRSGPLTSLIYTEVTSCPAYRLKRATSKVKSIFNYFFF